jgi:hypothetical protein
MMDVTYEKAKTWLPGSEDSEGKPAVCRADGTIRDTEDITISEARMPATPALMFTVFLAAPTAKKQQPRICHVLS